jgi:hypothetical protein
MTNLRGHMLRSTDQIRSWWEFRSVNRPTPRRDVSWAFDAITSSHTMLVGPPIDVSAKSPSARLIAYAALALSFALPARFTGEGQRDTEIVRKRDIIASHGSMSG